MKSFIIVVALVFFINWVNKRGYLWNAIEAGEKLWKKNKLDIIFLASGTIPTTLVLVSQFTGYPLEFVAIMFFMGVGIIPLLMVCAMLFFGFSAEIDEALKY